MDTISRFPAKFLALLTPDAIVIAGIAAFIAITSYIGITIIIRMRHIARMQDREFEQLREWNLRQDRIRQQAESIEDRIRNGAKIHSKMKNII